MPRRGSVIDDKVCRVPKLTSFSTVARSRALLTSAAAARGTRSATSGPGGGGGGAARAVGERAAALRMAKANNPATEAAVFLIRRLCAAAPAESIVLDV